MIKKLAQSVREFKKPTLLTPLFVGLEVVMEVFIPLVMANLIYYGIDGGNLSYVIKTGLLLLLLAVLAMLFGVLGGRT